MIETNETASAVALEPKTKLSGKVVKITLAGALVDVGQELPGVIHISQIQKDPVNKVEDVLKPGQSVDTWVRRVRKDRIELTMIEPLGLEWGEIQPEMVVKGKVIRLDAKFEEPQVRRKQVPLGPIRPDHELVEHDVVAAAALGPRAGDAEAQLARASGGGLRQLRARHGRVPRIRRRAHQGEAAGTGGLGHPVPAHVHGVHLVPLQGILEGREVTSTRPR